MSKAFDLGQLIGDASKLSGGTIDNDRILLDVSEIPNITSAKISDLSTVVDSQIKANTTFSITGAVGQYTFNGTGTSNDVNPNLYLYRGMKYYFDVNANGHPFWINSTNGTGQGNAFNDGVTNNGAQVGLIEFSVPMDAPETLHYNCEFHSAMNGEIHIVAEGSGGDGHSSHDYLTTTITSYTATAGQTVFDIAHKSGNIDVWYNGVYMINQVTANNDTAGANNLSSGYDFQSLNSVDSPATGSGQDMAKISFSQALLVGDYISIRTFS